MIKVKDLPDECTQELSEKEEIANRQKKLIDSVYQKAEKRYNELERNYNDSGSGRTRTSMYWWEDIMNVCQLAEYAITADCPKCADRKRDIQNLIHKYRAKSQMDSTVRIEDVINDLEEFLEWYK